MIHRKLLKFCRHQFRLHGPKQYLPTADPASGLYQVLSTDPPIFYVKHWLNEELKFLHSMDMLFEYLSNRKAYFLYSWGWNIDNPARVKQARHFERRHQRRYRHHQFIHLCNSPSQRDAFLDKGLQAVLCNQNSLADERLFRPLPDVERTFDAVYSARFLPYKRHQLASTVQNLGLIYPILHGIDREKSIEEIKNQFPHAHFFNHSDPTVSSLSSSTSDSSVSSSTSDSLVSSAYRQLNAAEVNACLNRCRVGLCLSAIEGAMYASIEYLLAGLPVVSTKNKGGRDVFLDDSYALFVDDDPEAVREGVEEMIRREISPEFVRQKTLEKVETHRKVFFKVVQEIYKTEGVTRDFAQEWPRLFTHKLYVRRQHKDTIAELEAALQPQRK